ncbi:MAG: phosphoribosylaminoimidazolesuccinocarboxamide synthase [Phycisphaera sp.]|nr:phosphoribosylaminoimidazolesuccinocarboxamide synthase [Phycisphaera sp.]
MPKAADPVFETHLPLPDRRQGKVRDVYRVPTELGPDRVLVVATDRISAFDVVMPTPIPGKGRLLTETSVGWFQFIRDLDLIGDHLISTDPADVPGISDEDREMLDGRMMLCRAVGVVPIECVARGYLAGSGWNEYVATGSVCGIQLPEGLERCGRLPRNIFTPATKATEGHDENIDFERAAAAVGETLMERLRDLTLAIYDAAADFAAARGVILADTKFEFGHAIDFDGNPTGDLLICDEVLTPDSSRYWPAEDYESGREQASFDKQFVRNHLLELVERGAWDKEPPGPALPPHIVERTMERYGEAADRLFSPEL